MAISRNTKKGLEKPARKRVAFVVKEPSAKEVVLAGDFTGWQGNAIPLKKGHDGEWHIVLELEPGQYQYRLRVDGQWRDHPDAHKRVPNPFGGENCVLMVEG